MPPKKNAFYNYMEKRRRELEDQGKKFPGGWKDVASEVGKEWEAMSPEDRRPYDPRLRSSSDTANPEEEKVRPVDDNNEFVDIIKLANPDTSISPDSIESHLKKSRRIGRALFYETLQGVSRSRNGIRGAEIKARNKLMLYYNSCLENEIGDIFSKTSSTADTVFILISFHELCVTDEREYIPAEIALVAFSIRQGVVDQYSTIIDPGELPMGMCYEASLVQDKLYLPAPPFDEECADYEKILRNVKQFIANYSDDDDGPNPGFLFCRRRDMTKIYKCLNWLCMAVEVKNTFDVYPFEYLLTRISRSALAKLLILESGLTDPADIPYQMNSVLYESTGEIGTEKYFASISAPSSNSCYSIAPSTSGKPKKAFYNISSRSSLCPSGTKTEPEESYMIDLNSVLATERQAGDLLDNIQWASLEYLACLHHQNYSEALFHCVLSKLNGYAYQTIGHFMLQFDVRPVPGLNFPNERKIKSETMKRHTLLFNWGLKSKKYPSYVTPIEREEKRAGQIARMVAHSHLQPAQSDDLEPQHRALIFRPRPPLPEFVPIFPEGVSCQIPWGAEVATTSYRTSRTDSTNVASVDTDADTDFDDDGWSYQGD